MNLQFLHIQTLEIALLQLEQYDSKIRKKVEDVRGKIFFFSQDNKRINLVEIKKGFSPGMHS